MPKPRKPKRPTIDDVPTVDIMALRKEGVYKDAGGIAELSWPAFGVRGVVVVGTYAKETMQQFMRVEFDAEDHEPFGFTIPIRRMSRSGPLCPDCKRSVEFLCLIVETERFACMECTGIVRGTLNAVGPTLNEVRRDPSGYAARRAKYQSDRARYVTAKNLMKAASMPPIKPSHRREGKGKE